MKAACSLLLGIGLVLVLMTNARADDKEVTLQGVLICGKCTLKKTKECTNVLRVKADGKTVDYYLEDKGKNEVYHKNCCNCSKDTAAAKVTVSGVVVEKDGKKILKTSKVLLIK